MTLTMARPTGLPSPPSRFQLEFPAKPTALAEVRHAMQDWLRETPLDERTAYDVLLATGEACANAIEHGHRGDGGAIRLRAALDSAGIRITVRDHGRWKRPAPGPDPIRGRGIAMIRTLIPEVRITTSEHGTTVEMWTPIPFTGR